MKRTFSLLFLTLAVMLGLSMAAFAQQTLYFNGNTTSSADSVGTGIYEGTLANAPTTFFCDDYPDHIVSGESWTVSTFNLEDLGNGVAPICSPDNTSPCNPSNTYAPTGVRFPLPASGHYEGGETSALQAYSEVAWLAQNMFTNNTDPNGTGIYGSTGTAGSTISWAIWTILDSPPAASDLEPGVGTLVTDAENWWASLASIPNCQANPVACGKVPNINIYTPWGNSESDTGEGYAQEFIGPLTTPEPLSMALMGTFLTLAGFALGRKKLLS